MLYSMMYCYDKHSNLIAVIENTAVSEISHHTDCIYLYSERKYVYYEEFATGREYAIKASWVKTRRIDSAIVDRLKAKGIPVIFYNDKLLDKDPDLITIGF